MVDAPDPVELHRLRGLSCIYCEGADTATPDAEPTIGSPVFCAGCGGLMVLDGEECPGELLPGDLLPALRRPRLLERDQLMKRPDVAAVRDAWNLDQLEARVSSQAEKGKVKNVTGRRHRTKSGETVRLEYRGPDA